MVKMVDIDKPMDTRLPFDVVDDVAIYMRNDPMFYRKKLFPAIMKMKDLHDAGKEVNPNECLGECARTAMESYCQKFKLGSPKNVFKDEDEGLLIKKLFGEEMKMIKDGAY
jgi:hypothetical protein